MTEPKTETIPKAVRKSFINWLVPALCASLLFAAFTVAKSWADDRYTQKTDSDKRQKVIEDQMEEGRVAREKLQVQIQEVNRKLDLIVYILQHDNRIDLKSLPGPLSAIP